MVAKAFGTIVITASDEAQADCFRRQAKAYEGRLADRVLVVPDPGGRRVGTLGSTVNVLRAVPAEGRMLVCHCGGFSKRLPAYAASGKVFAPVPSPSGARRTLFEAIVSNMSRLRLPASGALVVCGDLAPRFDFGGCDFSSPGVTGVGFLDAAARGSRHGVYVPSRWRGCSPVAGFLQKPSEEEARRAGALRRGRVVVDTGILWIDSETCGRMARSGWAEGDLYSDFTAALLGGFAPFSVNVAPRCEFFHIGSSRELLDLLGGGREWVDGCGLPRSAMRLGGENIVVNVPAGHGEVRLGRGECLLCLPVGRSGWEDVRYRVDDNFKGDGKWEELGMGRLLRRVNYARLGDLRAECGSGGAAEVEVRRPLRIDLAGGWSDTPPICQEVGGCVLNAAVTLDSEMPVKVRVRRLREREVRISSVDLRRKGVLRTMEEVRDHADPSDWRALVKSALSVTGYDFSEGGLEIEMSADVPKGSGMGTSSILGSAVVEALGRVRGRPYSVGEVAELTMALEREMRTGGGWEDQMGALVPGVKLLVSARGERQRIRARRLSAEAEGRFAAYLSERALLYFTGQKRMARNVLNGVISYYRRNPCNIAHEIVKRLKADAAKAFEALERGDWHVFTAVMNAYWNNKKALDPGSTNPMVESIMARIAPLVDAATLCGAGGGGFMLIIACGGEAKRKIRRILETGSPIRGGRFYDFGICS